MEEFYNTQAPANLVEIRRETCRNCTHLEDDRLTCGICKCPLIEKATYLPQKCPIGKWGNGAEKMYAHLMES